MATLTLSVAPADFALLTRLAKADCRPVANLAKRLLLDIESGKIAIPAKDDGRTKPKTPAVTINDDADVINTLKALKTKHDRPISELLRIAMYEYAEKKGE